MTPDVVQSLYRSILQRDPQQDEINAVLARSAGGASDQTIRDSLTTSAEAQSIVYPIVRLYQAAFGRVPDKAGLDGWRDLLASGGTTLTEIAAGFVGSQEFFNRYKSTAVTEAFLQGLYTNVLGRTGAPAEILAWQTEVAKQQSYKNSTDVLIGFSQSPEFTAKTFGAVQEFLDAAGRGTQSYTGPLITFSGQSYTLTTATDFFNGTPLADTFTGTYGPGGTLSTTDIINGGDGNDLLSLTLTSVSQMLDLTPTGIYGALNGIERLNVENPNIPVMYIRGLNTAAVKAEIHLKAVGSLNITELYGATIVFDGPPVDGTQLSVTGGDLKIAGSGQLGVTFKNVGTVDTTGFSGTVRVHAEALSDRMVYRGGAANDLVSVSEAGFGNVYLGTGQNIVYASPSAKNIIASVIHDFTPGRDKIEIRTLGVEKVSNVIDLTDYDNGATDIEAAMGAAFNKWYAAGSAIIRLKQTEGKHDAYVIRRGDTTSVFVDMNSDDIMTPATDPLVKLVGLPSPLTVSDFKGPGGV